MQFAEGKRERGAKPQKWDEKPAHICARANIRAHTRRATRDAPIAPRRPNVCRQATCAASMASCMLTTHAVPTSTPVTRLATHTRANHADTWHSPQHRGRLAAAASPLLPDPHASPAGKSHGCHTPMSQRLQHGHLHERSDGRGRAHTLCQAAHACSRHHARHLHH